ncbi:ASCH domain-containing protein [Deinococcus sp.]|uniref:ASCH domain-containing protein n=1 Tax=Deinococcus sp. TaxID=47478 RepID=UPI0025EC4C98|nr:ASCH domain-containing protein [Deinococcus sp.]
MTVFSPEVQAFVMGAEAALGRELPIVEAFGFGDSPQMADELAALVLSGQKTATCGWPADLALQEGSFSVMLNGQGAPLAVIETLELRAVPFLEVEAQFAYAEGEGDRTLEWWRDAHRHFFSHLPEGAAWNDGQVVQCERFRVVFAG